MLTRPKPAVVSVAAAAVVFVMVVIIPVPSTANAQQARALSRRSAISIKPAIAFQSSSVEIPLIQYNICSSACGPTRRAASKDILAYITNGSGAWSVSVNEACAADLGQIASATGLGAVMVFAIKSNSTNNGTNCPGADRRFGNIVLIKGPELDGYADTLSNPGQDCSVDECRVMLCLKMGTYVGPLGACSSHFVGEASQKALAQQQANEYLYGATAFFGSTRQYLMGDFNLQPDDVPSVYFSSHNFAVYGLTAFTGVNATPDRQLDYIWIEGSDSRVAFHPPYCPNNASDHCLVRGDQKI